MASGIQTGNLLDNKKTFVKPGLKIPAIKDRLFPDIILDHGVLKV